MKKFLVVLMVLVMAFSAVSAVSAEGVMDYEELMPLMDLVSAASQYSANAPESVPGSEGVLSASFTNAFTYLGTLQSPEVGVTEAMLTDTAAQAELLKSIFAAELPQLEQVPAMGEEPLFVGFCPKTVTVGEDGMVEIVGEIYAANKAIRHMAAEDFASVSWVDRAIYLFKADPTARNGYRLEEYSYGMDLAYEEQFQRYSENVSVEYVSPLGFSFLYPAAFDDELLLEDDNGVSASMEDGTASFFARKEANTVGVTLEEYVNSAASAIPGCVVHIYDEMQYATIFHLTDDGFTVFDVYVVTDGSVYQAEIRYETALSPEYCMFNSYLENSFVVSELYQG